MSKPSACGLCSQQLQGAGHRSCGVDLCDVCYSSDLAERLVPRGFAIKVESWVTKPKRDDDVPTHHTRVTGTVRVDPAPRARFSREGLGTRIRKFFGGAKDEVQAGDALFDDAIYVETDTPDITRRLLGNEGLQMVILEAVTDADAIRFEPAPDGCQVVVHTTWNRRSQFEPKHSQQRLVALALHHLRHAADAYHGSPRHRG